LTGALEQCDQDAEGLLLQTDPESAIAQFPSVGIYFESAETKADLRIWPAHTDFNNAQQSRIL
jgi:hypothetical protein